MFCPFQSSISRSPLASLAPLASGFLFLLCNAERLPPWSGDETLQPAISRIRRGHVEHASSMLSIAERAADLLQRSPPDDEDRDHLLDHFFEKHFGEDDGDHGHSAEVVSDLHSLDPHQADHTSTVDWKEVHEHNCGADGVLNLSSTSLPPEKPLSFWNCHRVVAQDSELLLTKPLHFNSDVEMLGRLTVTSAAQGKTFTCLTVAGGLRITGNIYLRNCYGQQGGAIRSQSLEVSGALKIENSTSFTFGGAISTEYLLLSKGGLLDIQHCESEYGGGVSATEILVQGGQMLMENCRAREGGSIWFRQNFTQLGGRVDLRRSFVGGALHGQTAILAGGSLLVQEATATYTEGGCVYVSNSFQQSGGFFHLRGCESKHMWQNEGGCMYTVRFLQSGGTGRFERCRAVATDFGARSRGGGLSTESFLQTGGDLVFEDCLVGSPDGGDGGCIFVDSTFKQVAGRLTLRNCTATRWGGAISLHAFEMTKSYGPSTWVQEGGEMAFEGCHAGRSGGAIYAKSKMSIFGHTTFHNTTAGEAAGGIMVFSEVFTGTPLYFSQCRSKQPGAALMAHGNVTLQAAKFDDCNSDMLSVVIYVKGDLTAQRLDFAAGTNSTQTPDQHVAVGGLALVESFSCKGTRDCDVSTTEHDPQLQNVYCPAGHGVTRTLKGLGCQECSSGTMSLFKKKNAACQPCPDLAEICLPDRLKMPFGKTVDPSNFSVALHCPNPRACLGGVLSEEQLPLLNTSSSREVADGVSQVMCRSGYAQTACWKCVANYGMTDASPLLCSQCSDSAFAVARSIAFYLGKDAWPFLVAIGSALTASASGERKQSTVLMNQLMAFGMVAQHVVNILMQTRAFNELHLDTRRYLVRSAYILSMTQAEGGEDHEEGSPVMSRECLLKIAGWPSSLIYTHLASAIMPMILVVLVAIRYPWLSLMVGSNVFLPAFAGTFGKYLLGFSWHPPEGGSAWAVVVWPFLPESAFVQVLTCLIPLVCLFGTISWWWHSIRSGLKTPGASAPPPHVLYLTLAYKDDWRAWEIERFLRKVTLSFVAASLSASYWDAMHLFIIFLILLSSLLLTGLCRPYKNDLWNASEAGLLTASLMMISSVNMLRSNDEHWTTDLIFGKRLAAGIIALTVVVSSGMMLLVMFNIYREMRKNAQ